MIANANTGWRRTVVGGLGVVGALALGGALLFVTMVLLRSDGFSARERPSALEAFIARRLRVASIPAGARLTPNPVQESTDVIADARAHYADHCAGCHGADGSGRTQVGENLYPKVPDMRAAETQRLSDGELFFIIENGIRFTGMPAWSHGETGEGTDSWKLVRLIRRMPEFTRQDIEQVRLLMPQSGHQHDGDSGAHHHDEGAHAHSDHDDDHDHGDHGAGS
ncbi:c-type cytochrome [Candidatus Binatia bacterium]|jgi:mono/diheme cytochrome c family protein|nr:c-type cytochrome [Candidatus Binatia bacterium]